MTHTTRRAILTAVAIAPVALAGAPAIAVASTTSDPKWIALVAEYHDKRAAWLDTCSGEDDLAPEVTRALAALPFEPQKPACLPYNLDSMTIAQIKGLGNDPTSRAAWKAYEYDLAVWKEQREAVREAIVGPAQTLYRSAYTAYSEALNALSSYRTTSLPHLAEKMTIVFAEYEGCDIPPEYVCDMRADVLHLAGRAAS